MFLIDLGAGDNKYDTIVANFNNTIMKHNNGIPLSGYNIAKVQFIDNNNLNQIYAKTKERIESEIAQPSEELLLYHGTPQALKIAEEGFNENLSQSNNNMLGKGIYFADISSKSNQYAWGNMGACPVHRRRDCTLCLRQVLVCSCIMGNIFEATTANTPIPGGYHSVVARPGTMINPGWTPLRYPEYSILSGDQVLPQYLIEYSIVP